MGATLGLAGANQWAETRIYNSSLQARRVEVAKGASSLRPLRWAYSDAYNLTTLEETGTDAVVKAPRGRRELRLVAELVCVPLLL